MSVLFRYEGSNNKIPAKGHRMSTMPVIEGDTQGNTSGMWWLDCSGHHEMLKRQEVQMGG